MASTGSFIKEIVAVLKSADTSVANDNTLNDDPHLIIPIAPSETLIIQLHAFWIAAAGGIRIAFSGPAGTLNIRYCISLYGIVAGAAISGSANAWDTVATGGVNDNGSILGCLNVENGVNAGNIVFRWAQNASNAGATTIHRGSLMTAHRVGG